LMGKTDLLELTAFTSGLELKNGKHVATSSCVKGPDM
jgi:hypothetical protein